MANDPMWNFDVPTQMRQFAEQSVEQAKKAVDGFLTAAHKTAVTAGNQTSTAQSGAKDVSQKVMGFAEQNITQFLRVRPEAGARQGHPGGDGAAAGVPEVADAGHAGAGQGSRRSRHQSGDGRQAEDLKL